MNNPTQSKKWRLSFDNKVQITAACVVFFTAVSMWLSFQFIWQTTHDGMLATAAALFSLLMPIFLTFAGYLWQDTSKKTMAGVIGGIAAGLFIISQCASIFALFTLTGQMSVSAKTADPIYQSLLNDLEQADSALAGLDAEYGANRLEYEQQQAENTTQATAFYVSNQKTKAGAFVDKNAALTQAIDGLADRKADHAAQIRKDQSDLRAQIASFEVVTPQDRMWNLFGSPNALKLFFGFLIGFFIDVIPMWFGWAGGALIGDQRKVFLKMTSDGNVFADDGEKGGIYSFSDNPLVQAAQSFISAPVNSPPLATAQAAPASQSQSSEVAELKAENEAMRKQMDGEDQPKRIGGFNAGMPATIDIGDQPVEAITARAGASTQAHPSAPARAYPRPPAYAEARLSASTRAHAPAPTRDIEDRGLVRRYVELMWTQVIGGSDLAVKGKDGRLQTNQVIVRELGIAAHYGDAILSELMRKDVVKMRGVVPYPTVTREQMLSAI